MQLVILEAVQDIITDITPFNRLLTSLVELYTLIHHIIDLYKSQTLRVDPT